MLTSGFRNWMRKCSPSIRCKLGTTSHISPPQHVSDLKRSFEGWCTNYQNLREQQHIHHSQDCTGNVHHGFRAGGVALDANYPLARLCALYMKSNNRSGHIWMASAHGRTNISRGSIAKTACQQTACYPQPASVTQ